MKKKMFVVLLMFSAILLMAEGLDKWGIIMRNQVPNAYAVIKANAMIKWEDTPSMIVIEINHQSKAAIASMSTMIAFIKTTAGATSAVIASMEFRFFRAAVDKWSYLDTARSNMLILDDWLYGGGILPVYAMPVDWTMVESDYLNQIKATNGS